MARRPGGGSGGRNVPGLSAALSEHCRKFGQAWDSQRSLLMACDLDAGEPVEVDGVTLWRVLFNKRYPNEWAELMADRSVYVVVGDRFEQVDA